VTDSTGEAGQIGGGSVGQSNGRGAQVESLRRHEKAWCRFSNQTTATVERGTPGLAALAGPGREINICRRALPFWQGSPGSESQ
jgi:hypothetical protein